MSHVAVWLSFFACLVVILLAGTKLAKYGEVISVRTGLGGLWVGVLLLSVITSLPEVFNGVGATVFVKEPDLTVGDLFGSNVLNLTVLAFMDLLHNHGPVLSASRSRHIVPALYGIVLVGSATGFILLSRVWGMGVAGIGLYTPVIFLLYVFFMRSMYRFEKANAGEVAILDGGGLGEPMRHVYAKFSIVSLLVIGAGLWLSFIGRDIAELMGWGTGFVGSLFIAISTSLPEISICLAAVRMGAVDMAVGNVMGSNMINMFIVGLVDLFYRDGPILADVSHVHTYTGIVFIFMTAVVVVALAFKVKQKKPFGISWYVPVLLGLFAVSTYLSYGG